MPRLTLQALGRKLLEKRGKRGVRAVADDIGISHATLSRVERGYLPDLETFAKICRWLEIDHGEVLGAKVADSARPMTAVHFRRNRAISADTAKALAEMIMSAQQAMMTAEENP